MNFRDTTPMTARLVAPVFGFAVGLAFVLLTSPAEPEFEYPKSVRILLVLIVSLPLTMGGLGYFFASRLFPSPSAKREGWNLTRLLFMGFETLVVGSLLIGGILFPDHQVQPSLLGTVLMFGHFVAPVFLFLVSFLFFWTQRRLFWLGILTSVAAGVFIFLPAGVLE